MKRNFLFALWTLLVLSAPSPSWAQGRKLSDEELDKVTAGKASAQLLNGVLQLHFHSSAGPNHTVEGSGTLEIKTDELPNGNGGILILQDSAQENLRSLININAVNSKIQVLLNLNININSTVGSLRQINLSSQTSP